ncbi:MAG: STAS domain-containing protein [Prochloraceae cyanobacterium]|nr:STAS domain-containing protein [Prochloraceae cyanobacterium]
MANRLLLARIATVKPKGHLSAANTKALEEQLIKAIKSPENSIILVDMSQVNFIDSAALMVLVKVFRQAQSMNKRFSLCSVAPSVSIIFELCQLNNVFEIFETFQVFESTLN